MIEKIPVVQYIPTLKTGVHPLCTDIPFNKYASKELMQM